MDNAQTKATPDKEMMGRTLDLLYLKSDVAEMRIIHKGRKRTDAGYYDADHRTTLISHATANNSNRNFYVTLNPVDPQLLGRYCNRIQDYAESTATDKDIPARRTLLIDCDPVRPKDTASTDIQLQAAMELADRIRTDLSGRGFPEPAVAMSGNGAHLLYRVDLPNTDEVRDLIKEFLVWLSKQYDTEVVTIDKSVFNAARITKLYGSVATKGDNTSQTPHRTSYIVSAPDSIEVVDQALIAGCIPTAETQSPRGKQEYTRCSAPTFDIIEFLSRLAIPYTQDTHSGADRFKLDYCPFNSEHGKGEAAIFQSADGKLGFKCQHDSCSGYHWGKLRALVDGERPTYGSMPFSYSSDTVMSLGVPDILTDQRLKYYFASSYRHTVRYVPGIGWLFWDGRRWCTDMPGGLHPLIDQMQRYLMDEAQNIAVEEERLKRKKALLGLEMHNRQLTIIQACQSVPDLITEANALDRDKMLFNVQNGTIDLRSGNLWQHNPDDRITRISTVDYNQSARCPVFLEFITWAMCGDMEMVSYLQRFVGYCLTGETSEQILNFWYGIGGNGKTTLMNVIQWLLSDYATTADTSLIMQRSNGNDGNRLSMLAGLRGSRVVTLSEVNDGEKLDEAAIKSFTGGDTITCRHLYEGFFSYTPQSKLIGFGNYKPHVRGTDHGIWRRIHLVLFRAVIPEHKKDVSLPDKLRAEIPGILTWAVQGCLDWQRIGLAPPASIRNATDEYRQTEDMFSSWLGECCTIDESKRTPALALITSFKDFSGWKGISERKFGDMLREKGFVKKRSNGIFWQGIALENGTLEPFTHFSGKSYKNSDSESFGKIPPIVPTVPFSDGDDLPSFDRGDDDLPEFDLTGGSI